MNSDPSLDSVPCASITNLHHRHSALNQKPLPPCPFFTQQEIRNNQSNSSYTYKKHENTEGNESTSMESQNSPLSQNQQKVCTCLPHFPIQDSYSFFLFKPSFTKKLRKDLLSQSHIHKARNCKKCLKISNKQFKNEHWNKIFFYVDRIQAEQVNLLDNFYPKLLMEITHISFVDMRFLNIANNQICSLEALALIDAERLEAIVFRRNNVVHTKAFFKAKFKNLEHFDFAYNKIQRFQVDRMKTSQMVKWYTLGLYYNERSIGFENISNLSKFEAMGCYEFKAPKEMICPASPNIEDAIGRKYPKTMKRP